MQTKGNVTLFTRFRSYNYRQFGQLFNTSFFANNNGKYFRFLPPIQHWQITASLPRPFSDDFPPKDHRKTTKSLCWKCGKKVAMEDRLHCPNCRTIQPIFTDEINYFTYLGLEPAFRLDEEQLKERFRQKQAVVHPDKFSQSSEEEQFHSEQHSSFLNNAYRTLRDPYMRADYLLGILEKSTPSNRAEQTEDELVEAAEIMAMNEEIEEMEERSQVEAKIADLENEIRQLFVNLEEQLARKSVSDGRKIFRRIGYLRRSRKLLEAKLKHID